MLFDLGIAPESDGVDPLFDPLVHRAWSACRAARDGMSTRVVFWLLWVCDPPQEG
ncbi:MAG: hypothetical protein ACJAZO_003028 [Myxococcota bacterium]|jgi:hypothetical protein